FVRFPLHQGSVHSSHRKLIPMKYRYRQASDCVEFCGQYSSLFFSSSCLLSWPYVFSFIMITTFLLGIAECQGLDLGHFVSTKLQSPPQLPYPQKGVFIERESLTFVIC